ncbi:MAG: hypothetical protein NTU48_04280 [Legionellales bacterium]|nr:hypothetical protein [Legionellales bacterium]
MIAQKKLLPWIINDVPNYLDIVLVLLISTIAAIGVISVAGVYDNVDALLYLSSGLSLLQDGMEAPDKLSYDLFSNGVAPGENGLTYPNMLYQILAAAFSKYVYGVTQPSALCILSCMTTAICNVFLYYLCRLKLNRPHSVLVIAILNCMPVLYLFAFSMVRPLSDCWLMCLLSIIALIAIRKPLLYTVPLIVIGFFMRAQLMLFMAFIPILSPQKTKKETLWYFLLSGVGIVVFSKIPRLFFNLESSSDSSISFYKKVFYDSFQWNEIINATMITFSQLLNNPDLKGPLCLLPVLAWCLFHKSATDSSKRMCIFALFIWLATLFFCVITTMGSMLCPSRYFIYAMPFSMIGVAYTFNDVYAPQFKKSPRLLKGVLFALAVFFLIYFLPHEPRFHFNKRIKVESIAKLKQLDFNIEDVPVKILPDNTVGVSGIPIFCRIYALWGVRKIVQLPDDPKQFILGSNNSKMDYLIFTSGPLDSSSSKEWSDFFLKDHIKDNKGVSFHKVYSSNNPLTLYTIFKREERTL